MKLKFLFILLFLCLSTSILLSRPATATFISDSSGNLYSYDINTNTSSLIGNSGLGTMPYNSWYDIALNPVTGQLYGITGYGDLYSISTENGSATLIGKTKKFINGLTFDSTGTLYGSGYDFLYTIDLGTGAVNEIGQTGFNSSGDLAFDSSGNLFMTAIKDSSTDQLVSIDLSSSTLSASSIGDIGYAEVYGLGFMDGTLYGFTNDGTTITIDTSTGAGTFFADNGINAYGAETAPVPEPSTILLMGLGLGGMALFGRKFGQKKA